MMIVPHFGASHTPSPPLPPCPQHQPPFCIRRRYFVASRANPTWYFLRNAVTHACLFAHPTAGSLGLRQRCTGEATELWQFQSEGQRKLVNKKAGLCLDPEGQEGKAGVKVTLAQCDGQPDQQWQLQPL